MVLDGLLQACPQLDLGQVSCMFHAYRPFLLSALTLSITAHSKDIF